MRLAVLAVLLAACAVDMPAGTPAPDSGPPMCAGYLVTSQCPGAPLVSGYPAIGCHDDAGKFVDGCLYDRGQVGHETTSLCVAVCPLAPPPPTCPRFLDSGACAWPECAAGVTHGPGCPSAASIGGLRPSACSDAAGRPVGGCGYFANASDGTTEVIVCSLACY